MIMFMHSSVKVYKKKKIQVLEQSNMYHCLHQAHQLEHVCCVVQFLIRIRVMNSRHIYIPY